MITVYFKLVNILTWLFVVLAYSICVYFCVLSGNVEKSVSFSDDPPDHGKQQHSPTHQPGCYFLHLKK